MAFLENPQVEEQPQVQTPQVEEPPKKKKLWSGLQQKKLYTKSYEDFEAQFSTPEKVEKLYQGLFDKKLYTKSKEDFYNQFFVDDVKKKEPAQPIQQPKEAVTTPTIQPSKETAKTSTNGAATQEPTNIFSPFVGKEESKPQPQEDVITLAKQADDLGKKTIQLPTNGGMMGTAPTEMPDENAIAQSKELKAKIKQQGYDADELNEAFKDFPEDLFNRKEYSKEKLLVLNKTNKNDFYRTVASAKWQSILLNAIKSLPQDDRRTKTALADWNSFLKNQQLAKDYEGGRQHTRDIVNMVYKYVDNVDEQNKILGYLGKDLEISYDPRIKGVKEALSSDPRKKYLTDNELLGLQYYEDINPQLANTFDDVLVDGTKLDTNAWGDNVDKGEQLGLQQQKIKLATQGLSIKSNAINEEKARIAAKGVQVTPEEKEKYDKLNEQSKEVEAEIKELTNPKSKEYGKLAEYNLDGVAQELFGQRHGLAANQGLKFLSGVGGNVGSVINMVAKPFLSDEGSKVWNLGQIGQSIKNNKNTYTTQENSLMQHFAVEETPAFTQQKNAILNDPNLTDEQKIQKGVELLSNNDGWQLVAPSKELNAGIMPLIYGIADTANGLGQFILTSTLLKGVPALSGATKASNFANIFASTFLQSFQPKLTANLTNNEEYPTAKAFLSSSIDGILFGAADKAGVIKKMFSPKSSIGKVINELSDAELNNIIKISKSGNVFKDILNAALSSAKHATPMVAAGVGGSIANDYINNDLKKAEEYFKEGLMQQAMFTLLGVPMGAMGKRGERKDAAKIAQELIDKRKQVDPTFGVTVEMPSEVAKQREGEVITTQPKEYTPETKKSGVTVILPKQNEGEIITTKAVTEKPTESTQSQSTEKESGVVTEPTKVSETAKEEVVPTKESNVVEGSVGVGGDVKDKVFVHETDAETFDKFDLNKVGSGQGDQWLGHGIYLQEKGSFKIEKYGKNKVETSLKPDAKIFKVEDTPDGKYRDNFVEWAVKNTEVGKRKAQERIDDGLSLDNLLPRDILKRNTEAVEKLKEQGYDGLYLDGELVVYNPDVLEIKKTIQEVKDNAKPTISKEQQPIVDSNSEVEAKKADIEIGKVGNTEYEVKVDGVYYKGKKLNNPENKTHRQLIEADIERRRKEELKNVGSNKYQELLDTINPLLNWRKNNTDPDSLQPLFAKAKQLIKANIELVKYLGGESIVTDSYLNSNLSGARGELEKALEFLSKEVSNKKEINTKYDAELKALENKPTPSLPSNVSSEEEGSGVGGDVVGKTFRDNYNRTFEVKGENAGILTLEDVDTGKVLRKKKSEVLSDFKEIAEKDNNNEQYINLINKVGKNEELTKDDIRVKMDMQDKQPHEYSKDVFDKIYSVSIKTAGNDKGITLKNKVTGETHWIHASDLGFFGNMLGKESIMTPEVFKKVFEEKNKKAALDIAYKNKIEEAEYQKSKEQSLKETTKAGSVGVVGDVVKDDKVYYHGTPNKDFNGEFDERKIGERDSGFIGRGFYFTEDKSIADQYQHKGGKKGKILERKLDIKNPFRLDKEHINPQELAKDVFKYIDEERQKKGKEPYRQEKREDDIAELTKKLTEAKHGTIVGRDLKEWIDISDYAKSRGYDAIIGSKEVVVFDKSQIKAVEQSLKETTKSETPTTNTGVEEGSGVGGDVEAKINKVADEYLYHGTGEGAFRRIREEGLTPQGEKYLYFADKEQYAKTYAQRKGNSFGDRVLRVKKSDAYLPDENTTGGDFKIKNKINPNDIEIKHNGKWIPIQEFADENIGIMPISKAVEQSIKETTKAETPTPTQESNVPVSETKEAQPIEPTKVEEKKTVSNSLRDKAKQVREQGVNKAFNLPEAKLPDGTQQAGFGGKGLNEAIAKSLEIVADAIDAGKEILDAAKEGFENIKAYYKENAKSFDEAELRNRFIDGVIGDKVQADKIKEQ